MHTTKAGKGSGPKRPNSPTYCPYCGSDAIKQVHGVPRCMACRAVFFVSFSRYARKSQPM